MLGHNSCCYSSADVVLYYGLYYGCYCIDFQVKEGYHWIGSKGHRNELSRFGRSVGGMRDRFSDSDSSEATEQRCYVVARV